MDTFTDEMIAQVGELTDAFTLINANRAKGNVVPHSNVKSTPVHVQGTPLNVNKSAGHVQTALDSVINLISKGSSQQGQDSVPVDEGNWLSTEGCRIRGQPAAAPSNAAATSSSILMTLAHVPIIASSSSQNAMQTGELNRTPTVHMENTGTHRVVMNHPPSLPSGTQRAIENIVKAHLEKIGYQQRNQGAEMTVGTLSGSTAGNVLNSRPEISYFLFRGCKTMLHLCKGNKSLQ